MTAQSVLVLGGTGFVGRQLLQRLSNLVETIVIARSAHLLPPLPKVEYYRDSLDNLKLLNTLLPRCRLVIHLASDSTPGSSVLQPTFEVTNNLMPTLRFLEVLHQYDTASLIYLSSGGAIYGNPTETFVNEDIPLSPLSYYGAGKAAIEKFIIAFCQQTQHSAVILRPANFYGPQQPLRSGFGIVTTLLQGIRTQKPLQIWGDGENIRDYLYIHDFVDLCVQLILQPFIHRGIRIYNVGSGQGTSLNQLCALMEQVTQQPVLREYHPARVVDVRRIVLDCRRIQQDYHWSPRTDLLTGLTKTWQWFKNLK